MTKILTEWMRLIIDPLSGFSRITDGFVQSKYKATMDIVFTEPSGSDVTFAMRLYGVFPTTWPTELGSDVTQHGLVELSETFSVDRVSVHESITEEVKGLLQEQVNLLTEYHDI